VSGYGLSASVQRTFEVDKGFINALEYDGNGNLIYYGTSYSGAAFSEPKWKIMKLAYDGNGNLLTRLWAGGVESFTQIWDNRAGLTYS